jgi:hypothetical protein
MASRVFMGWVSGVKCILKARLRQSGVRLRRGGLLARVNACPSVVVRLFGAHEGVPFRGGESFWHDSRLALLRW